MDVGHVARTMHSPRFPINSSCACGKPWRQQAAVRDAWGCTLALALVAGHGTPRCGKSTVTPIHDTCTGAVGIHLQVTTSTKFSDPNSSTKNHRSPGSTHVGSYSRGTEYVPLVCMQVSIPTIRCYCQLLSNTTWKGRGSFGQIPSQPLAYLTGIFSRLLLYAIMFPFSSSHWLDRPISLRIPSLQLLLHLHLRSGDGR